MEEMIEYILQFGSLNKQQTNSLANKGKEVILKKDGYFSEAEKVPKQVGFVVEGVVRGGYHNNMGEDITRCFISENSLVAIMSTTSRQAREAYGKIKITRQRRASEHLPAAGRFKSRLSSKF